MGVNKFHMKKSLKQSKIDRHGLCLNEYKKNYNNAQVYFDRATGKSPEMEVSKAMANIIKKKINLNNKILDVGCACGHFYRSIKKRVKNNFYYTGTDPYPIFLDRAKVAWKKDKNVNFVKGNIYDLPFKKNQFDLSFCSNVFIHLNDVKKPLKELLRVTKKTVVIRTVLYDVSYKIQLVYNNKWWSDTNIKPEEEFDNKGNPKAYSYFNILSFDYITANIKKINPNVSIKIIKDNFFNKKVITKSQKKEKRPLATRIIGDEQISGCILQPHYFIIIDKKK